MESTMRVNSCAVPTCGDNIWEEYQIYVKGTIGIALSVQVLKYFLRRQYFTPRQNLLLQGEQKRPISRVMVHFCEVRTLPERTICRPMSSIMTARLKS